MFEPEIRTWPSRTTELCERYLMTRIYSVSYIKPPEFTIDGAVVEYGATYRDLGMDFDLRFRATLRWSHGNVCRVHVKRLDEPTRVYNFSIRCPTNLADAVFGPFETEKRRSLDRLLRD